MLTTLAVILTILAVMMTRLAVMLINLAMILTIYPIVNISAIFDLPGCSLSDR